MNLSPEPHRLGRRRNPALAAACLCVLFGQWARAQEVAPVPVDFPFTREPLQPEFWPAAGDPVNRDRIFDFYAKQANWARTQAQMPALLSQYPGLDGGKDGHWGNQNEATWRDDRWNKTDLGSVVSGVVMFNKKSVPKGVCVRLGEAGELACCFDPATLTYPFVWKGGFVKYDDFRHGIGRGVIVSGEAAPNDPGAPAHGVIVYHGFYRNGPQVIFSYSIDGVEMLDAPTLHDRQFVRIKEPATNHPMASLLKGGPAQWPQVVETHGQMGRTAPFAVDTIALPFENPWKSLFFVGDHDFMPNGDGVLCTIMGEVWTVSGLDGDLSKLRWRRIATGLNQPLGLRVVDGVIHVLGRDQITRLHDLNGDGETDFYECFSNVYATSPSGHDFITGLQHDAAGNWYSVSANQGLFRISSDGRSMEVIATGFRNANGVGLGADGTLTTSCQEGNWTPASQICLVPPGVRGLYFGYGGPKPDVATTPPLVYLPRGVDNSTGGQCFVESDRWGIPRNTLLSVSWGTGTAMMVVPEKSGDIWQAAAIPLPGEFRSGSHRGRFREKDGQFYVTGCQGWGSYTPDDGCFQRLRWTGDALQLPLGFQVRDNGVLIRFAQPLDAAAASNARKHFAQTWNYHYAKSYGSPEFSTRWPDIPAHDPLEIKSSHVLPDGHSLFLEIPQLQPASQLHLSVEVGGGRPVEIFASPHHLGAAFTEFAGYQAIAKMAPMKVAPVEIAARINPWKSGEPGRAISVETASGMRYATTRFVVKSRERLSLTLSNPDTMPHNLAIAKPGTLAKVGDGVNRMAAQPDGASKNYIAPGDEVLFFTDIIDPGKSFTIHFNAPAEPGEYPYLCTFPGHWQIMNGVMVVE